MGWGGRREDSERYEVEDGWGRRWNREEGGKRWARVEGGESGGGRGKKGRRKEERGCGETDRWACCLQTMVGRLGWLAMQGTPRDDVDAGV